jgi:hypothetical protein
MDMRLQHMYNPKPLCTYPDKTLNPYVHTLGKRWVGDVQKGGNLANRRLPSKKTKSLITAAQRRASRPFKGLTILTEASSPFAGFIMSITDATSK